jgi:hypothetical protein
LEKAYRRVHEVQNFAVEDGTGFVGVVGGKEGEQKVLDQALLVLYWDFGDKDGAGVIG